MHRHGILLYFPFHALLCAFLPLTLHVGFSFPLGELWVRPESGIGRLDSQIPVDCSCRYSLVNWRD